MAQPDGPNKFKHSTSRKAQKVQQSGTAANHCWLANLLLQSLYHFLFAHVSVFAAHVAMEGNSVQFCSLRALYGTDGTQNATHGSDSPASAAREIRFFFPQLSQVDMPYQHFLAVSSKRLLI